MLNFCLSKKTDVKKTTRLLSVGSCEVCFLQLQKQIKLFDTRAFRLVTEKFRLIVQSLESNGPVKMPIGNYLCNRSH